MKQLVVEIINEYGYMGILILTAIESIVPVIPAEFILTIGGYATTVTDVTKGGVVFFASLGEIIGAFVLYMIGYFVSYERLEKILTGKIARVIHLKKGDIEKSKDWFLMKGKYTVMFSKCIPIIGSLISIPAGMAHMNIFVFLLFTMIGITVWNTILVNFGATIKKSIDIILLESISFSTILALVFIICFIIVIVKLFFNKGKVKLSR